MAYLNVKNTQGKINTKGAKSSKGRRQRTSNRGTNRRGSQKRLAAKTTKPGKRLTQVANARAGARNTAKVNGKTVSKNSDTYKVKNGITLLAKRGIATSENSDVSTAFSSEAFLFAIGCTIVKDGEESKDTFSLLDVCTDSETIANENIYDTQQFEKTRNKNIALKDKFKSPDDTIYELDDSPSLREQEERRAQEEETAPSVVGVAGALVTLNTTPGNGLVLKQLLNT